MRDSRKCITNGKQIIFPDGFSGNGYERILFCTCIVGEDVFGDNQGPDRCGWRRDSVTQWARI